MRLGGINLDIGGTFSKVWQKAAMIALAWGIIASVLGLIPVINLLALIITVPAAFVVPALAGYLAAKDLDQKEVGGAAMTGAVAGVVYGLVAGIIGVVFTIISVIFGISLAGAASGLAGSEAGAASAAVTGGIGLVAVVLQVVVGIPFAIVFSLVLAAVGGALYTVIKK